MRTRLVRASLRVRCGALSVVIDTRDVPAHERFELWADETPRVFEPLAVRPAGDAPFAGRVVRHDLGALTVFDSPRTPPASRAAPR